MPAVPAVVSGRSEMLEAVEMSQPCDAAELVERLKTALFKNRIRIADFFVNFDPLRTGTVTEAKLRTAMQIANVMPLTEREMQVLSERYSDATGNGLVNYKVRALIIVMIEIALEILLHRSCQPHNNACACLEWM